VKAIENIWEKPWKKFKEGICIATICKKKKKSIAIIWEQMDEFSPLPIFNTHSHITCMTQIVIRMHKEYEKYVLYVRYIDGS